MRLAIDDDNRAQALRTLQGKIGGEIIGDKLMPIGPYLSALLPLDPATELHRRWYVVQVEPQQECKVADAIVKMKLDVFNPQQPRKVRVNPCRHRMVKRPLVPGYVFAGFDMRERWQAVIDIHGAVRLIMIGERPVPVPEKFIEHLRQKEIEENGGCATKGPKIRLVVGQFVRILEPVAFAGLWGVVIEIDEEKRKIKVEIDIFGRPVPVELEPEQVEGA